MKLLLCNQREAGKNVLILEPESEYFDLTNNLVGTYIDMMSGEFMINPLEPKAWNPCNCLNPSTATSAIQSEELVCFNALDCLWGELYGSINMAEISDGIITSEQADYLRKKYLWR